MATLAQTRVRGALFAGAIALGFAGCGAGDDSAGSDAGRVKPAPDAADPGDAGPLVDAGIGPGTDGGVALTDAGVSDGGMAFSDAGAPDGGIAFPDAGAPDGGMPAPDAGVPDAGVPDAGLPDAGLPDAGVPDAGGSGGVACSFEDGQALWRLTFPSGMGGYATVEEWDNGCEYSLANQACSLSGEPHNYANFGPGIVFNSSSDFFRVRFSAQGLSFTEATIYISAHADGGGIPNAVLESPLYGSLSFAPTVPISTHRTYAVDWSDFLSPSDNPNLTAVTLRSNPTGLAVSAIELCVR